MPLIDFTFFLECHREEQKKDEEAMKKAEIDSKGVKK